MAIADYADRYQDRTRLTQGVDEVRGRVVGPMEQSNGVRANRTAGSGNALARIDQPQVQAEPQVAPQQKAAVDAAQAEAKGGRVGAAASRAGGRISQSVPTISRIASSPLVKTGGKIAGGALVGGLTAKDVYDEATDDSKSYLDRGRDIASTVTHGALTGLGGIIGGGLGSAVPVAGTIAGGAGGAYLGNRLADSIDYLTGYKKSEPVPAGKEGAPVNARPQQEPMQLPPPRGQAESNVQTNDAGFRFARATGANGEPSFSDRDSNGQPVQQSQEFIDGQAERDRRGRQSLTDNINNYQRTTDINRQSLDDQRRDEQFQNARVDRMRADNERNISEQQRPEKIREAKIALRSLSSSQEEKQAAAQTLIALDADQGARADERLDRANGDLAEANNRQAENPLTNDALRQQLAQGDISLGQSQRLDDIQRRVFELSQTDPQAARALAESYRAITGKAGNQQQYVNADTVLTTDSQGNPLTEPVVVKAAFDPTTGQQFGGVQPGSQGAGIAAPPKAEWIKQAAEDPRNAGVSREDLEAYYEQQYGR